ncbi:MAG: DUF3486 family protein [Nitrosomonadales bacterium]
MAPRSKVSRLPKEVKEYLDRTLVENNFSDYELLAEELKQRGFELSKSAIHRYGQEFETRLSALKMATQQAKAISDSIPDDEGSMNDALIRLVQQKAFDMLLKMEEGASMKEVSLMVARLSNATVKQKQWAAEVRAKAVVAADTVEAIAKKGGLSPDAMDQIRRGILGIAS